MEKMLSRLPGKVFGCDVALNTNWIEKLLTRQKVIPLSGKVLFNWDKHPGHRDLACQQARSRYTGKLVVSCERSVTFHISELKQVTFLTTRTAWVTSEDRVKGCDWWKTSTLLPVDVRVVKNITCLSSLLFSYQGEILLVNLSKNFL
jgi:hypothetical protein